MEYRVLQYGVDDRYIKAIHDGTAATGHRVDGSEKWFSQRFEQNPLGRAVLACAFDGDRMVACVAVERMPIQHVEKTVVGGCTHVLFVQEGYDTQVMWVGLLKVLEEECERQSIDFVVGFNDQNLIASAQSFGWMNHQGMVRYRLTSVTGLWRNIFKMLDMRNPFVADDKAEGVQNEGVDDVCIPDYFKWLIRTSRKRFVVVDNEKVCAVMVIGHRGKRVREAHICYFEPKKSVRIAQRSIVEFIRLFTKDEVDVISCVDGKNYLSKRNTLRTTQKVNYHYKRLNESYGVDIEKITQFELLLYEVVSSFL